MADEEYQEDHGTPAGGNTRNVPFPGMGTPIPSAPVEKMPVVDTMHRNFDSGGQATAIAPPPQEQPPSQVAPPVAPQEPPSTPDRELWEGLNKTRLYTDSYDDFKKQFNNPKSIDELYQGLSDSKLYTNSKEDFYSQFFQHLPPKEVTDAHSFLGSVLNTPAASKAIDKITADSYYKNIYQQQQAGASGRDATKVSQPIPIRLTADAEADRKNYNEQAAANPEILRPVLSEIKRQNVDKSMFSPDKPADPGLNQKINQAAYIADANTRPHSEAVVKHYADQLASGDMDYDIQKKQLIKPEGFIPSVFRSIKNHSDAMDEYDYLTSHSDDDIIKHLDEKNKNYDPDRPVYKADGIGGDIGNMIGSGASQMAKMGAGGVAAKAAGVLAPELALPIAAITTMGMGAAAQDFHHISYQNTLQEVYRDLRQKHPDADPKIILEEAKKQANLSGALSMGQGIVMGEVAGSKTPEFTPVRYGKGALKVWSDIGKNAGELIKTIAPGVGKTSALAGGVQAIENAAQGKPLSDNVGDAVVGNALFMTGLGLLHGATGVFLTKQARANLVDGYSQAPTKAVDKALGTLVANGLKTPEEAAIIKHEIDANKVDMKNRVDVHNTITPEAEQLLKSVEDGGVPEFMTKNLEKIAKDNFIEPKKTAEGKEEELTPNDVINRLKYRRDRGPKTETFEKPDLSNLSDVMKANYEKDPEAFLKEVADHAHGGVMSDGKFVSSRPGAEKEYGADLVKLATEKYPDHVIAEPKVEPEAAPEKPHHTFSRDDESLTNVKLKVKRIEEMSSEELRNHSKSIKDLQRKQEVEFFGEDGAEKFRDAQSVSNSDFADRAKQKEADKIIDEMMSSLTKKQSEEFDELGSHDPKEIRNIASKVEMVETSENMDELSSSIKAAVSNMDKNNPSAESLAILNAAKNKAKEMGFDVNDLMKDVLKKVASQYKDISDAETMVKSAFEKLTNVKSKQDAISIGSATSPNVAETSGNSSEVGGGKPGSEETAIPQENKNESQTVTEPEPAKNDVGEERTVGVRHESLRKIADRLGLEQPEKGTILSAQEQTERGRALLKAGADPNKVQEDFDNTGKVDADSISVARAHYENLVKDVQSAFDQKGKSSPEYIEAKKKADDWQREVMKPMGTASGGAFTALQGETDVDTGSFISMSRAFEERYGKEPNAEQEAKLKEASDKVKELTTKVSDLEQKLTEAIDKNVGTPKEKAVYTNKAKAVADAFRKLKTKPFTFKDENGNEINVTKMGVDWNDIVEAGAKIIEKTGEIADGIAAAIEKIKDADWYKGLSDSDKDRFAKQLEEHYNVEAPELAYTDLAERLVDKKDNKFSPQDAKDIWAYAKENYLRKGSDFDTMISGTAMDLGLTTKQVREAITSPKSAKVISDEMYYEQKKQQTAIRDAKLVIKTANASKFEKNYIVRFSKSLPNFWFALKTFGHGTVGSVTHSGLNAFDVFNQKLWKAHFLGMAKSWKYAFGGTTKGGLAAYQQEMTDLIHDKDFAFWKRNGLAVDPVKSYDDYQQFNKHLKAITEMGDRGFNALKIERFHMAKAIYSGLSELEKSDPNTAKEIASNVNHSTGTADIPVPKVVGTVVFAPRLEGSRWARMLMQPAKAVKTLYNWKEATPSEKVAAKIFAKRTGSIMATYMSTLAINSATLAIAGSKQGINYTDPTQSDWLKHKVGGKTIDMTGGMLSSLHFLGMLVHESIGARKKVRGVEVPRSETMMQTTGNYVRGKLSPFASTAADVVSQADYGGRPLPFSSDKGTKFKPQYTWREYLEEQQLPIPVSEAFKVTHDEMKDRGMPEAQFLQIMNGVISGLASGATGARVAVDYATDRKDAKAEKDKKSAKPSLPPTQYH